MPVRQLCLVLRVAPRLVVHFDQGGQYAATNFKHLLARHDLTQSMSRCGNCYDNAHAESFWSRLKTELLDGGRFANLTGSRLEVSQYIAYYNAGRRHSAFGNLAPTHFETHLQSMSRLMASARGGRPEGWVLRTLRNTRAFLSTP